MNYYFKVGDIINDREIIELSKKKVSPGSVKKRGEYEKSYIVKCLICGTEKNITEASLKRNAGCDCKLGRLVVAGVNDFATINPDLANYFKDKEQSTQYSVCSNQKVEMVCPDCGKDLGKRKIQDLHRYRSFRCSCQDKISYPERFMRSFLEYFNVDYEYQKRFEWSDLKVYDFYIPKLKLIIETDGSQHYIEKGFSNLQEQRKIDALKDKIAIENGLDIIRIDCSDTSHQYIKNSVLNSRLKEYFNFIEEDLVEIDKKAQTNLLKKVCESWDNIKTTRDLANEFKLNRTTISTYLKRGTELGWCNYNPQLEKHKKAIKKNKTGRKVQVFDKDGQFIGEFDNSARIQEISKEVFGVQMYSSNIRKVCTGERPHCHGYTFKYLE